MPTSIPLVFPKQRRLAASAILAALSLILSGCFLQPGKFTSELDIRKDGTFTYSYVGGIFLLPLAEEGNEGEGFIPSECYDDETFEEAPCTEAQLAKQRSEWEAGEAMRKQQAAQMTANMMGGIDPNDPEAAAEFAAILQRQKGYESVEYLGGGLFDIRYAISGTLSHDYVFPTIEGMPMANYFVLVAGRNGKALRIEAPGFAAGSGTPMDSIIASMGGLPGTTESGGPSASRPEMDGIFRIITDGVIRANNTDEGPSASPRGQVLEWRVNSANIAAPTALLQL